MKGYGVDHRLRQIAGPHDVVPSHQYAEILLILLSVLLTSDTAARRLNSSVFFPDPLKAHAWPWLVVVSHTYWYNKLHPRSNQHTASCRGQIQTVLTLLHSKRYMFGDLQKQNILSDADGNAKLIEFTWCGRYDTNIHNEKLPNDLQNQIDKEHEPHSNFRSEMGHACYLLSMLTSNVPYRSFLYACPKLLRCTTHILRYQPNTARTLMPNLYVACVTTKFWTIKLG